MWKEREVDFCICKTQGRLGLEGLRPLTCRRLYGDPKVARIKLPLPTRPDVAWWGEEKSQSHLILLISSWTPLLGFFWKNQSWLHHQYFKGSFLEGGNKKKKNASLIENSFWFNYPRSISWGLILHPVTELVKVLATKKKTHSQQLLAINQCPQWGSPSLPY